MSLGPKTCLFACFTLMASIFKLGQGRPEDLVPIDHPHPCLHERGYENLAEPCEEDIPDPCDGPWSAWGQCNDQCIQSRARFVPQYCPNNHQTRTCPPSQCCDPYQMTPWGAWGSCSVNCGTGTRTRSRDVAQTGTCVPCPPTTQSASCGISCQVTSWGAWGACTKSCGTGQQTRYRHIIKTNGCTCPTCVQKRNCNTQCCGYCKTCTGWWPFRRCHHKCC